MLRFGVGCLLVLSTSSTGRHYGNVPYTHERHDRQRWCEANATTTKGARGDNPLAGFIGPMNALRAYTRSPLPFLASLSLHETSLSSPVSPVTGVRVVLGLTHSPAALKPQCWTRRPNTISRAFALPCRDIETHTQDSLRSLSCACLSTLVAVHEVPSFRHITVRIDQFEHPAITHALLSA